MSPHPNARPSVLVFDCTDPTAAGGLQGAVVTLAAMGCLPLSVVTAIACGDTRSLEPMYPLDPEWVAEQARPLLEDMPVAAILVGDPGCADTVGVIAEIAADYHAPLVFAPGGLHEAPDPDDSDDLIAAALELLLPQTELLVVDGTVALRMVAEGDDEDPPSSPFDAAQVLLRCGAERVLLASARDAAMQVVDTLVGAQGIIRSDLRTATAGRVNGTLAALAAAVAAGRAYGEDCERALEQAHRYTRAAVERAFRPGMGAALPDRMAMLGARRS